MNSKRIDLVHGDIVLTGFPIRLERDVYLHVPFIVIAGTHVQIQVAIKEINSYYFMVSSAVLRYADVS